MIYFFSQILVIFFPKFVFFSKHIFSTAGLFSAWTYEWITNCILMVGEEKKNKRRWKKENRK